jgi:hypothetical protein
VAGGLGGEALGGPGGALAGGLALGSAGALAGGWGAHGAFLEGQFIRDILSHPENWTVDAAGAIVPMPPAPARPSSADESGRAGGLYQPQRQMTADFPPLSPPGPIPYLPKVPQSAPGGIPGLMVSITGSDPSNSGNCYPPTGGLLGLIQEYMRNNAIGSEKR